MATATYPPIVRRMVHAIGRRRGTPPTMAALRRVSVAGRRRIVRRMAQAKVGPLRGRIVRLGPAPARGLRRTVQGQTVRARVRLHRATAVLTALTSRNRARVRRATATIARRTQMAGAQMAVAALMSRRRVRAATGLPIRRPTPHRHATILRLRARTRPQVAVILLLRTRHLRARTLRPAAVIPRPAVAMAAVAAEVTAAVVVAEEDRTIAAAVAVRTAAVIPTDANST
jgi:hypothetical protein